MLIYMDISLTRLIYWISTRISHSYYHCGRSISFVCTSSAKPILPLQVSFLLLIIIYSLTDKDMFTQKLPIPRMKILSTKEKEKRKNKNPSLAWIRSYKSLIGTLQWRLGSLWSLWKLWCLRILVWSLSRVWCSGCGLCCSLGSCLRCWL